VTEERIQNIEVERQMKRSYLEYSMSVIVSRALPDVRDGLKPVHRRVLTAMNDLNLSPGRPYRKSAKITGDTTGNYHPHGTAAVYDTLVRMAQDFSLRYPLVDGQGNFGSIDGDSPAAERYTEARLTPIAMELLRDIDKDTVDFVPNYDGSREMPSVLPSAVPNLLINGTTGIAVGMATNCPPHNLREIVDGLVALLDDPEMAPLEMLKYVQGPDFPTGALVHGRAGIRDYITTGRGRVVMRARTHFEELRNGRNAIIVTEIPYYVNKAELIVKIAQLVREGHVTGIADLNDESDRTGMRIVVTLKRDAQEQVVLNQLFKHTAMQSTFGVNNLALVGNHPRTLNLKEAMQHYLDFREVVVVRRTRFDLNKAEERAHILEGYRIALDHIDEVIALIRASADGETARNGLMERFGLSERQAQSILELRLQRLTGLERDKIEAEYQDLIQEIERLRAILASRSLQLQIIREELIEIRKKYGDDRRTEIIDAQGDVSMEDLIAEEDMVVTVSHQQYIKRLAATEYRSQGRGGRGVTGGNLKDDDWVEQLFVASTHDQVLFFTNLGRVFSLKVHQIPEAGRAARGKALVNLLPLQADEKVQATVQVHGEFSSDRYLMFATANGLVKRTSLDQFTNIRGSGIRAIELVEGDQLIGVQLTQAGQHAILAVRSGLSIRFEVQRARSMGRTARGVKGIERTSADDAVVSMVIVDATDEAKLVCVTERGYGKLTPIAEYRTQGRGGKGIITIKTSQRNGPVVAQRKVTDDDELMIITRKGVIIRTGVAGVSTMGRNTQGVRLINLDEGDSVATIARIVRDEESELDAKTNGDLAGGVGSEDDGQNDDSGPDTNLS
jgi:DNA gyrase subunit A